MAAIELVNTPLKNDANMKWYSRLQNNSNDEIYTNHGTDTDISYVDAVFGKGAVLNGSSSLISVANATELNATGPMSMGIRIKFNSLPTGSGKFPALIAKMGDYTGYSIAYWSEYNIGVHGYLGKSGAWKITSDHTPSTGVDYLYIFVYDGEYIHLYCNGSEVGTRVAHSTGIDTTTNPLIIGRHYGGTTTYGVIDATYIDEPFFMNRALTPTEISNITNGTWGVFTKNIQMNQAIHRANSY